MRAIGDVILVIDAGLTASDVGHVLGGALALANYAEPRGPVDVDVNVGVPYESRTTLLAQLDTIGWHADDQAVRAVPDAGTRLRHDGETVVIGLVFALDYDHEDVLDRAVAKPFIHAGERLALQFLSAEDLTVFTISVVRPKDGVGIVAMIGAGTTIDPHHVERAPVRFGDPRPTRQRPGSGCCFEGSLGDSEHVLRRTG